LVEGHLVNPLLIGALPYQTSKFDQALESGTDKSSFVFQTERLEQFSEYEVLKGCEDED